jgi:hypothetical protein
MSCDKVVVPCQASGEVPELKGCPARSSVSSRKAEAPVVKKEAPLPGPPALKPEAKEEAKAETKEALAQSSDEKKDEKKNDKKVTKKE